MLIYTTKFFGKKHDKAHLNLKFIVDKKIKD